MNYIKYILIFFVFSIFASIGNMYSKKYYNRLQELEELLNMLNVFKAKIKFTAQSIQEIFEQIYQDNRFYARRDWRKVLGASCWKFYK